MINAKVIWGLLFCMTLFPSAVSSVFIEYEDAEESSSRTINVHFQDEEVSDGSKRMSAFLGGRGINFVEIETFTERRDGATHYHRRPKDFFTSERSSILKEWIEMASHIQKISFTGIDYDSEINSVLNAFHLIAKMLSNAEEIDDFEIVQVVHGGKEEGMELETYTSGRESDAKAFKDKFENTIISFKGSKSTEACSVVLKLLDSELPELKGCFKFEDDSACSIL